MDNMLILLMGFAGWWALRQNYERTHIALLARHLSGFQLERHMETLTQGYLDAIHKGSEEATLEALKSFASTEELVAKQLRALATGMQREGGQATAISLIVFYLPWTLGSKLMMSRDFRDLLFIHATGLRAVVDNTAGLDAKERAYQLSAELFLFQHSCHWFCKSRGVANARLMLRHKVKHQQVVESVSVTTRSAYLCWLAGRGPEQPF